ncbi:hypothetical protein [Ekhidna sp. To15]|uniref:hypothetical protein n=1 Tax=Ekhidna sp. To15 TaxID=3395267 RepID=UPI003F527941
MRTLTRSEKEINVLILKSNIKTKRDVARVNQVFSQINSIKRWSVDLEDWERVLKVESTIFSCENIAVILERFGYECSELNH